MNNNIVRKVHETLSYCSAIGPNNFVYSTIRNQIDEVAKQHPDKVAYIFHQNNGLQITYSSLKERVYSLANGFIRMGLVKGDRVALLLPNTYEFLIAQFAAACAGLINVPMDPTDEPDDYVYMMENTTPTAIILFDSEEYRPIIDQLLPELRDPTRTRFESAKFTFLKHVLIVSQNGKFFTDDWNLKTVRLFDEISQQLPNQETVKLPDIDPDDIYGIFFTVT